MSASDESTELLALLSMITSAEPLPIADVPATEAVTAALSASALDLFALSASASAATDSSASGTDDAPHDQESCAPDREEGVAKKQRREQLRERPAKKRTRKPCKPTYYVRKEEKTALLQEIQSLKAQIEHLQFQPPTPGLSAEDAMARNQIANMFLRDEVVRQQYALARLQSAQAGYVSAQDTLPYQTPIRLGKDWSERRATLAAIKNQTLRDAVRYITERSQFLDLSMPHSETSRYVTANGDFCVLRFDIDQIYGAKSVKQVFDALQSFFSSIEISISEVMGDITIREDDGHQELGISQLRFVTNVANAAAQMELNCAMFCDFSSGSGSNGDGSSNRDFGVITTDFIDEDELYPYSPGQRMRQDITAAATVVPLMRKKKRPTRGRQPHQECQDGDNGDNEEEELVVVLTRSSLLKLHRSDVVVPLHAQQQMREQVGHWGDFILKKLRENLTSAAATQSRASLSCDLEHEQASALMNVVLESELRALLDTGGFTTDITTNCGAVAHQMETPPSIEHFVPLCGFMRYLDDQPCSPGAGQNEAAVITWNSEGSRKSPRKQNKRKATYYVRKEEKAALEQQVQLLQAQLRFLTTQHGALNPLGDLGALELTRVTNKLLHDALKEQQFAFAKIQSDIAKQVTSQAKLPFETCLKLGRDWSEHRTTLLAAKDQMLQNGLRYVIERTKFLDQSAPYAERSRYATSNGDFCSLVFDVIPLEGATSVKQVFDALMFYFFNMEISISEVLGELTIREDDGDRLQGTFQNRFVSGVGHGIQVELNSAMFCQLFEGTEDGNGDAYGGGREYGVIVASIVDEDELFPYSPASRLRQDVAAAVTVTLQPRVPTASDESSGEEEEEFTVVVTRTCFLNLRKTDLPIPAPVLQELRDGIERWGDVMMEKAREIVYPHEASARSARNQTSVEVHELLSI